MVLKSQKRDIVGKKVKNLRKQNLIPASVYGPKQPTINLALDKKEFKALFKEVGFTKLFDLELPDGKTEKVLLKEVQYDYLGMEILHISMYKVNMDQKIIANVPVSFVGLSMAVKNNLGILVTSVSQVEVKCLPNLIPEGIVVDINGLDNVGDKVFVKDIKLPEGVELVGIHSKDLVLAAISAPQKAIEEETVKPAEGDAAAAEGEAKPEDAKEEAK